MLAAYRWADAKTAFARASRGTSAFRIRPLWHRIRSEQAGDRDAAVRYFADFLTAWKDADPAPIAHARSYPAEPRG
jgi:hypothetical protein